MGIVGPNGGAAITALRTWLGRPVAWGAVIISYIGIIAVLAFAADATNTNSDANRDRAKDAQALALKVEREAATREHDLCKVVISVNRNAKFRARTERVNLEQTLDYLKVIGPPKTELDRRVRANLPIARQRLRDARRNVKATTPPPTCVKYIKSTSMSGQSDRAQN